MVRAPLRIGFITALGLVLLIGTVASASPPPVQGVTIYLNYRLVDGQGYANAVAVIDSTFLAPNSTTGGFTSDFTGLLDFSMTVTDIAGNPTSTSFSLANLDQWVLDVGPQGTITDLNFFMYGPNVNSDGYSILGVDPITIALYDGPSGVVNATTRSYQRQPSPDWLAVWQGRAGQQELALPTLSAYGYGALALLLAGAAVLVLRRYHGIG